MKKILSLLTAMILVIALVGCTQTNNKTVSSDSKIKIVASIFPAYDFARAVAGDNANVKMLIKPGTEIHSFEPSPSDIIEIQNCDIFIYNGGEADAWADSILSSMDTDNKKIIRMMDFVTPVKEEAKEGMEAEDHAHEGEEDAGEEHEIEYDEHVWTSPKNAILITNGIAAALCKTDAANAEAYTRNAEEYTADIEEVDEDIQNIVDKASHKIFVVGDRFPLRYFADEFGLDYRAAFNGCSTGTEASAATIAYLIDTINDNSLSAVFYIELSNQNIAKAISEQTNVPMLLIHSCHNVSQNDFDKGVTYVSLMKQNAVNLKKGLD